MGFAGGASLAEHDAVDPVVADDAAPQRVVEIEHQAFLRQPPLRSENTRDQFAVHRCGLRCDFELALKPAPNVEPGVHPVPLACSRDIENAHAVARRGLAHLIVEARDGRRRRPRNHSVVAAEQRLAHIEERLLDDRGRADLARLAPERPQIADKPGDRAIDFGAARGKRDAGDRFARGEREEHSLRLKPMQGRRRIEQVLTILPVSAAMNVDQQFSPEARDAGRRR